MFPLLLLFYLSFLSIYYPPFLGYININSYVKLCEAEFNGKTKFEGCKVWHSWKITADKRGKRLKIFPYGWKKSDIVGKLLWMEGNKFRYGWKKSDMVGKLLRIQGETTEIIPIWLEKVRHGRKITVDGRRQIPTWWEISLRGWEKVFRHIGHLVWSIHRIGGNFPSHFLSVYNTNAICSILTLFPCHFFYSTLLQ